MHSVSFTLPFCQVLKYCWLKEMCLIVKIEERFCERIFLIYFLKVACNKSKSQVVAILVSAKCSLRNSTAVAIATSVRKSSRAFTTEPRSSKLSD